MQRIIEISSCIYFVHVAVAISKHQQFTDMIPASETLPSVKARMYASYVKPSSTVESAIFLLINDKARGVYDCSSPDKKQPSGVCI